MLQDTSSRSALLSQKIEELLDDTKPIMEQLKSALSSTLTSTTSMQTASHIQKFKFLMDVYYLELKQEEFSALLELLKGDGKEVSDLRNDVLSRRLNIDEAYNISMAKELSAIFGCLIINSLVRYYNLYMVNALSFMFLSSALELATIISSLMIGYQITKMTGSWITQNCFPQEKSKVKFSSIIGSVHFENYFICSFGKTFYDSLHMNRYEFEDSYSTDRIYKFTEFADVISARKAIIYKYAYYQKHMNNCSSLQDIAIHRSACNNMCSEFSSIKLPDDVKNFQFLESAASKKIWNEVASAILTRGNFNKLLKECKDNEEYKKFICMLYDSSVQYHVDLDLEEIYVLSELVNQCIFPNYQSILYKQSTEPDISNANTEDEGSPDEANSFRHTAKEYIEKKIAQIFEKPSIDRLLFSFEYLHKNQKNCRNMCDEQINNTIKALLLDKSKGPYLEDMDSKEVYKKFAELSKSFQRAELCPPKLKSSNINEGSTPLNYSESWSQLLIHNLRSICASDKYNSENKIAFMKSCSTFLLGMLAYGISNTSMINFALTGMTIYIAYECIIKAVGKNNIDRLLESTIYYTNDKADIGSSR